jgi:hypothetical protein
MTPAEVAELLQKHRELEALITAHNWWLGVFTITVALGILAETLVEFFFSKNKPRAETVLTVICSVAVLGGVVGEYIQGSNVSDSASELQQMADNDVARLYKQAGQLSKDAESARGDIATANARVAEADARAKEAEAQELQLAQQFKPRFLSFPAKEADRIAKRLKPFANQAIDVFWLGGDPDTAILGSRIAGALIHAGWRVNIFTNTVTTFPSSGIIIDVESPTDVSSMKAAEALSLALKPYDFKPQISPFPVLKKIIVSYVSFGNSKVDAPLRMLVGTK